MFFFLFVCLSCWQRHCLILTKDDDDDGSKFFFTFLQILCDINFFFVGCLAKFFILKFFFFGCQVDWHWLSFGQLWFLQWWKRVVFLFFKRMCVDSREKWNFESMAIIFRIMQFIYVRKMNNPSSNENF